MTCSSCSKPLVARQKMFCSRACVYAQPAWTYQHDACLDLFRQTAGQWLTASDISFWLFGTDRTRSRDSVRMVLCRLQKRGHRIESRLATWEMIGRGAPKAYRLVEHAMEAVA